jgi:hypothetical protein
MVFGEEARSRAAWFLEPLSPRRPFFSRKYRREKRHQQGVDRVRFLTDRKTIN